MVTSKDIENRFNYHPPRTPETIKAHEQTREIIKTATVELNKYVQPGREHSIMLTKLEEAMFWGNAAIARGADNAH